MPTDGDRIPVKHTDRVAKSAGAALAADADAYVQRLGAFRRRPGLAELGRDGQAAIAAAAADALRLDAMCIETAGVDNAAEVVRDRHRPREVTGAAAAAERATHAIRRRVRPGELRRDRQPTVTAFAADALREDPFRGLFQGRDRLAVRNADVAGSIAAAALTADRQADREGPRARRRAGPAQYTGNSDAAITATAADALREDAVGILTTREDAGLVVDIDVAARAAHAAFAADADRRVELRRRAGVTGAAVTERAREAEAAVAAAAADALREQARRAVARGLDPVAGDTDTTVQDHRAAVAPTSAVAADAEADGRATPGVNCHATGPAASAAAAADALREDRV